MAIIKNIISYTAKIDKDVLTKFKEIAKRDERSQQSLMNKLIKDFVEANY